MSKAYTSEQFWKLYEKLPQDLQDALFSEETGKNISEICERNDASDNINDIVDLVGQVLVGVLPADDFQKSLEEETGMESTLAKKIAYQINRFIFFPVKASLSELHNLKPSQPGQAGVTQPNPIMPKPEAPTEGKPPLEKESPYSSQPKGPDAYREPIE